MKKLQIAKDLSLPVDVVTQTVAVLAKRRAGKSYTMRRLVEQLHQAGQQVVLVDPKGDQWGVLSSADGKSPGLPFIILGGERGHVKLESGAGEVVAKLVVEERVSIVLDLSLFRKHEVATFMTAFLENLYRLKAKEIYRTPVMLVMDEADAIAPQKPQKGEERMLGAAEDIVRRGGQRGIGCVLVTQRSAVLNKNVLTQAQILIALRTIAPQDLDAMKAWIDVHGTVEQQRTLMESLPSLPVGDAWVWSPGWPTVDGIFKRVHVLPIETFDSGKTPEPGSKPVEPKTVADVDIKALERQMAATIERAKADDPRELKKLLAAKDKQIKELEANRAKATPNIPANIPAAKPVPALTDADRALIEKLEAAIRARTVILENVLMSHESNLSASFDLAMGHYTKKVGDDLARFRDDLTDALEKSSVKKLLEKLNGLAITPTPERKPLPPVRFTGAPSKMTMTPVGSFKANMVVKPTPGNGHVETLTPARQKILNALAFFEGIGIPQADKTQLALIVGVSPTSGGYFNNLGGLRSSGLIDYPQGGTVALTADGRSLASNEGIPETTQELHDAIRAKLPPAKWKILEALIQRYPQSIPKDQLAEAISVSPTSGGYFNNLGSLRSLGLLDYPRPSEVVALPVLFLEGR